MPGDRTAGHRLTRAESEKARRHGRPEAPSIMLRRIVSTAAAGAANEEEFFTRLRKAGVLVRTRISPRDPRQVTGYAVALYAAEQVPALAVAGPRRGILPTRQALGRINEAAQLEADRKMVTHCPGPPAQGQGPGYDADGVVARVRAVRPGGARDRDDRGLTARK
jgi:hypothetical protein